MTGVGWPTLIAAVASVLACAALLDVARVGRRPRPVEPVDASAARWSAAGGGDEPTERLLDAAGRQAVPDAAALAARRRIGAIVAAAWGGAVGWLVLPPPLALCAAVGGAVCGRLLPDLTLRRAARQRAVRLRDEVPEVLDLLAAAVGCGLPLRAALDAAGQWSVGELSSGVERAATELGRGAGTWPTLDRLLREHPMAELDAAVAILERSRVHGTPASEPLRALAAGARHARARRAMEHAARAAPRVQLVAALLLVPAALCVLAAALLAGGLTS